VRWSTNQGRRWGSCTPSDATIRISDRVRGMPRWVLDYVLLHELAHLVEPGHGAEFWKLLEAYPRTERARGWLDGFAAGRDLPQLAEGGGTVDD
jgi:predicted metal-dependent hydrolase